MAQSWLNVIAWVSIGIACASAARVVIDIYGRGYRQPMRIMEAVWPITALYLGPVAVWGYHRFGRPSSDRWLPDHPRDQPPSKPGWAGVAVDVCHCGAGCTLGDIIAEVVLFAIGASIAGLSLLASYVGDYVAAASLGILFQYFAIAPMRGLRVGAGLVAAAKADIVSLTAFEVGLFGWMALMTFVFFPTHHLQPSSPAYWLLMQIGMIAGFVTAWPANAWLIRAGIKEAM